MKMNKADKDTLHISGDAPSYNEWTKELKNKVSTKPQIKNKWKIKRFKKMYDDGLTVLEAFQCWYCAHCWG